MLQNAVFIFNNGEHMCDLSDANIGRPDPHVDRAFHRSLGAARYTPEQQKTYGNGDPFASFAYRWNEKDHGRPLSEDSLTDMAMAQAVGLGFLRTPLSRGLARVAERLSPARYRSDGDGPGRRPPRDPTSNREEREEGKPRKPLPHWDDVFAMLTATLLVAIVVVAFAY